MLPLQVNKRFPQKNKKKVNKRFLSKKKKKLTRDYKV